MSQIALFSDHVGFDPGTLFNQSIRKPSKKQLHKCGWRRRRAEYANTPVWADQKAINKIYDECYRMNRRDGSKTWAADHIVPLNHPIVCGLHVTNNLRIIPYLENAKKSNLHWPNMPEFQVELF